MQAMQYKLSPSIIKKICPVMLGSHRGRAGDRACHVSVGCLLLCYLSLCPCYSCTPLDSGSSSPKDRTRYYSYM